ncbi:hypothetical protein PspLS_09771 [Pyricularia sp. CBS 133598]|nr:hypothetical protein PspLS_09771 [Pyricularia sp. CBS 133598]
MEIQTGGELEEILPFHTIAPAINTPIPPSESVKTYSSNLVRLAGVCAASLRTIVVHLGGFVEMSSGNRNSVQRSTPSSILTAKSACTRYGIESADDKCMLNAPQKSDRARTRPWSPSCAPTTTVRVASVNASSSTKPSQARPGCAGKRLRARELQGGGVHEGLWDRRRSRAGFRGGAGPLAANIRSHPAWVRI